MINNELQFNRLVKNSKGVSGFNQPEVAPLEFFVCYLIPASIALLC